ncbi:alpha/beta hydrolase [Bowmanella sp. Y26]|uniref:alpha/beta hydrolase n=1 Tax=Bowmanella yangjiangensis TaxID=2811230 RepID=UPI001BDBF83F|nr:alpha/beta hydrolase [Bowmanella yangjiangensis]MBT1062602.1 alpha/beta hydrolase [Bowmanella yangjiangensis]
MFIVTNREVNEAKHEVTEAFGEKPMAGANSLRLAEASRKGKKWHIDILPDLLTNEQKKQLAKGLEAQKYASAYVASKLIKRCRGEENGGQGRNLLLYVHGFNNDINDILERAEQLEKNFNVEVLCFSWPANGGGLQGVLSYKSDKRDALVSLGALDRVFEKMSDLLKLLNQDNVEALETKAEARFGKNSEAWDRYFTKEVNKKCPFTVNLMLHSMGNYLFKHLLRSSTYNANRLLFDNVVMIAADTNNQGHAQWVDKIQFRNRLYITINEKDVALRASRLKMGEQQHARLGHYLRQLDAQNATYVDVTHMAHIGDSHAYFEGEALENAKVRTFFNKVLNGESGERTAKFDVARNVYRL